MTREQLKKYAPYLAAGLAAVVFLILIFRPLNKPEAPETPSPADDPSPDPGPVQPAPQYDPVALEAGTPLFDGPAGSYTMTLGQTGLYAVADRKTDGQGKQWALIDAPEGWVNLHALEKTAGDPAVISYADPDLLSAGGYLDPFHDRQVPKPVVIRPREQLTDLRLYSVSAVTPEDGVVLDRLLLDLVSLDPETPLVLRLDFPGSASVYGLVFKDADGKEQLCTLLESGKDGSLLIQ